MAPADEVDMEIIRQLKQGQELDEEDHYGQSVAGTLRKMSPEQRALAKIRIQQILYEIQYSVPQAPYPGNYHQYFISTTVTCTLNKLVKIEMTNHHTLLFFIMKSILVMKFIITTVHHDRKHGHTAMVFPLQE